MRQQMERNSGYVHPVLMFVKSTIYEFKFKMFCSALSNEKLVDSLVRENVIQNRKTADVMKTVDRGVFVLPEFRRVAYEDRPLPIGHNVTISAPHMHAMMLDLMVPHLGPGTTALDVGSGSGYIVACMVRLGAIAYGIEHIKELVPKSISALNEVLPVGMFEIKEGDGRLGWPEHGPYDVIHVGAAAQADVIEVLMKQLKPNGILIIPVEVARGEQSLFRCSFGQNGDIVREKICDVRFVPLTDAPISK